MPADERRPLRSHWPLAVILAVAMAAVLTGLGRDHLWADEGDTAVLARNILRDGVPTAWDGVTFVDSDYGARLSDDLVMVSSPWLQYYVTAASFALFGESPFAARLPFALLGLLCIALTYLLAWHATRHRWTAASAALLLTLSVQFLLYARQSRHYTLNAALTCLLVWQFTRMKSWRDSLLFAVVAILLFHSHPIALAPLAAMGVMTFISRPFRPQQAWFLRSLPFIGLLTLPWLVIADSGYSEATSPVSDLRVFFLRVLQFLIEAGSVTSIVGIGVLLVTLSLRRIASGQGGTSRAAQSRRRTYTSGLASIPHDARALMLLLAVIVGAYAAVMALTQPRNMIFEVGMRYTPAVLPFMAVIAAVLIAATSRGRRVYWIAMLLVFGFTRVGRLTPWTAWQAPMVVRDQQAAVTFHVPERALDRWFRTGQIAYVQSLGRENPGTTSRVTDFLREHAHPSDVVITNYAWEPLYFHTGLRQGMSVLPGYPIYEAARAKNLPEYVFDAKGARWVVWRRVWGAYRGHAIDDLLRRLAGSGVNITLMATFKETLWENRENLHFRRFADERYIYPWHRAIPDAVVYRLDWPGAGGPASGD